MLRLSADWLAYSGLGLSRDSRAAGALSFFIYDSVKICALLFIMIALIGFARTYLPAQNLRQWFGARKRSHLYAALFGAATPFCSCSSIPIFISFLRAGIPLGVSFSFLVTSPLINEYLVILMLGAFGLKVTVCYVASGLLIGTVSGFILGRLKLERYLEADLANGITEKASAVYTSIGGRLHAGWSEAVDVLRKLWLWVIVGVGLGALIHEYIPDSAVHALIGKTGFWSVPLATLLGVPMYASCAAIVPVAVALFQKGVPLGTALAFMMAVAALSAPEAVMLRRAMKLQLIGIFFAVTAVSIMLVGYLLNVI